MAFHALNVKIISHALCMHKHAKLVIYFIIKTRVAEMSTGSMAAFHDSQGQSRAKRARCVCKKNPKKNGGKRLYIIIRI